MGVTCPDTGKKLSQTYISVAEAMNVDSQVHFGIDVRTLPNSNGTWGN